MGDGLSDTSLFSAIIGRRSCREFTDQAVEWEKVCEVISAGMQAPSSGNLQNWSFIVVTEKEKLHALFSHSLEQEVFLSAQIGIIVCGDEAHAERFYGLRGKRLYTIQNCAACVQNMLLAAHSLGLGACWVGAFDEEHVASRFSIPEDERAQAIILLGYPAGEPDPKERKELADLVYFNEYGQKVAKPHLILRDYSVEWEQLLKRTPEKPKDYAADPDAPAESSDSENPEASSDNPDSEDKEPEDKAAPDQQQQEERLKATKSRLQRAIDSLKDEQKLKRRGK